MDFMIHTLGCKVNSYQSEGITAQLEQDGHTRVFPPSEADLILINTCTVTAKASSKGRQLIRRLRRDNPDASIVVIGCDTAVNREQLEAMQEIDGVLEYKDKYRIIEVLQARGLLPISSSPTSSSPPPSALRPQSLISSPSSPPPSVLRPPSLISSPPTSNLQPLTSPSSSFPFEVTDSGSRTRGLIQIQDGCDAWCSYCILPQVRGPLQSRPLPSIISEAQAQIKSGCPEIVITGIHTGAYGKDLEESVTLADVLEALLAIPGKYRIRLSSIEIHEITERIINQMANDKRLCAHLPIPLQSGSDRILHRMNRKYTSGEFLTQIRHIRTALPDCGITTDIMCGFPGETDQDFENSIATAEAAGFSRIHAFKYSIRKGTKAADMPEQIIDKIKTKRISRLNGLGRKLANLFAQHFIGKTVSVIPETFNQEDGLLEGYSAEYVPVRMKGDPDMIGKIIKVRGVKAVKGALIGEPV